MTSDLPVFVQPAYGVLQALLLLLREDVSQLIACLQEHTQNPLVQVAEVVLRRGKRRGFDQNLLYLILDVHGYTDFFF